MSSISSGVLAQGVIVEGFVVVPLPKVLFDLIVGEAVSLEPEDMLEVDLMLGFIDTLVLVDFELIDRVATADNVEVVDMLELNAVVEEEIVELEYLESDKCSSADINLKQRFAVADRITYC